MIVKWTTSAPLLARIQRNIRTVDADFSLDIPEWIAEAIFKMKTHYQLELKDACIKIVHGQGALPCGIEALAAVTAGGVRLMAGNEFGPMVGGGSGARETIFQSIINFPQNIKDIDETDINDWPFYLNTVEALGLMPVASRDSYRVQYNMIKTTIPHGELKIYYWATPTDEHGFPMIPDNENYQTAIYWYVRMMMIGAGFVDPVFNYQKCEYDWNIYASRAINEITYPTPDEKRRTIMNTVSLIPKQYDWETFDGGGEEGRFNDDI